MEKMDYPMGKISQIVLTKFFQGTLEEVEKAVNEFSKSHKVKFQQTHFKDGVWGAVMYYNASFEELQEK